MMNSIKAKNGQTLIEALVTILFIGICIIALVRFQNYIAYDNSLAQQKSEATFIAQNQIETLRDYQVINNTSGYTSYQSIATGSANVTRNNTTYAVAWTVTTFTNPNYKTVDLTVTWTDRYNVSQSVRMISNIAEVDPSTSSTIM